MSVPFSGTLKRSGGIGSAIAKQLRFVNLKPVKKVDVKFDPFNKNVTETRYVRGTT
jgi:large subunit ribosomal protein L53